jgi:hypothetical protein
MTIAIDRPIQPQPISFDEFLDREVWNAKIRLVLWSRTIQC